MHRFGLKEIHVGMEYIDKTMGNVICPNVTRESNEIDRRFQMRPLIFSHA